MQGGAKPKTIVQPLGSNSLSKRKLRLSLETTKKGSHDVRSGDRKIRIAKEPGRGGAPVRGAAATGTYKGGWQSLLGCSGAIGEEGRWGENMGSRRY